MGRSWQCPSVHWKQAIQVKGEDWKKILIQDILRWTKLSFVLSWACAYYCNTDYYPFLSLRKFLARSDYLGDTPFWENLKLWHTPWLKLGMTLSTTLWMTLIPSPIQGSCETVWRIKNCWLGGHHGIDRLPEAVPVQEVPFCWGERTSQPGCWWICLLAVGSLEEDNHQDWATNIPCDLLGCRLWRNSWSFPWVLIHYPLGQSATLG